MEIKGMSEAIDHNQPVSTGNPKEAEVQKEDNVVAQPSDKTIIRKTQETTNKDEKRTGETDMSVRGDQYISSEQELHDASGLYSVSRGTGGGLEIKFDDINLQKKRNALKQEITKLQAAKSPESRDKEAELKKKLAAIEIKIRLQKHR